MSKSVIGPCAGCCCTQSFPDSGIPGLEGGGWYGNGCCFPIKACLVIDGWDLSGCNITFPIVLGSVGPGGWTNDPSVIGGQLYPDCYIMCWGSYTYETLGDTTCGPITGGCGGSLTFRVSPPNQFNGSLWTLDISEHGYCNGFSGAGLEIASTTATIDCTDNKFIGMQFTNFQPVWQADGMSKNLANWVATITPLPCSTCDGGWVCEDGHCVWRCHAPEGGTAYANITACRSNCGAGYYCVSHNCAWYDEAPPSYTAGPFANAADCSANCSVDPGWYCVGGVCAYYDVAPDNFDSGPWPDQSHCEFCCGEKYYCIVVGDPSQNQRGCVTCPNPDTMTIVGGPYDNPADCSLHCTNQSYYCVSDPDIGGANACYQYGSIGPNMTIVSGPYSSGETCSENCSTEYYCVTDGYDTTPQCVTSAAITGTMTVRGGPYSSPEDCSNDCKAWYCCEDAFGNRNCSSPATGTVISGPFYTAADCSDTCLSGYTSMLSAQSADGSLVTPPTQAPVALAKNSRRAVFTLAAGVQGREMLAITRPYLEAYSRRIGADFVPIAVPVSDYPQGEKLRLSEYAKHYERCVFLDADVIPDPKAPDIFSFVPPGTIGMYDDLPDMTDSDWLFAEYRMYLDSQGMSGEVPQTCLNTGVVVFNGSMSDIWKAPEKPFPRTFCMEQNVINVKLRDKGYPVKPLAKVWNYQWWTDNEMSGPAWFWHYSGCRDHKKRLELLTAKAKELYPNAAASTVTKVAPMGKGCVPCGKNKAAQQALAQKKQEAAKRQQEAAKRQQEAKMKIVGKLNIKTETRKA